MHQGHHDGASDRERRCSQETSEETILELACCNVLEIPST